MSNEVVLKEIPEAELRELKELYRKRYSEYFQTYFFLRNMVEWKEKVQGYPVKFYAPSGNWKEHGTFLAVLPEFKYKMHLFTMEKSTEYAEALMSCIARTSEINFNKVFIVDTHERLTPQLQNILIPKINKKITETLNGTCWFLPLESARKFPPTKLPEDFYTLRISPNWATTINSYWPEIHRFPKSENFVRALIERNESLGVFTKKGDVLAAWVLLNEFDGLAMVQTVEGYRRKGFATILIKEIAKNRAERGLDTLGCILQENEPSIQMFKNIGFKLSHLQLCVQL